jgi:DHA3 family macrolide efflux protein-like MFS transporter
MSERNPEIVAAAADPAAQTAGAPAAAPAAASPANEPPRRPFFVLWSGQTLSLIGSHAVQFAIIWWLTATTGSATVLATASLLGLVPQVALGPIIGTLIDRWSRKRVMLLADGAVAAASLVLAILYASGAAHTGHVFALLFVRALGGAFHAPAMLASTSLMVPERHLTQIQGLNQSAQGLLLIVGAPLGALLYAVLPMAGVLMVDVGTALVAILPLLFIHVPQPKAAEANGDAATGGSAAASGDKPSVWGEMIDGFRYLRRRTGHLTLVFLTAAVNMLLVPAFSLLPLLVLERLHGNATALGWITSAFGIGMLAGGILLGTWGGFPRRIVTTLVFMAALGLAVIAVGMTPADAFPWALGAMFAVGFTVPLVNGPLHAIFQATIPPELQGRIFALTGSLAGATAPIGLLFAAPIAELVGVGAWYLAGGVMCVAMAVTGFLMPALMRLEAPVAPEGVAVREFVPDTASRP